MARVILLLLLVASSVHLQAQSNIGSDIIEAKLIYFTSIAEEDSVNYYSELAEKKNLFTNQGYISVGDFHLFKKHYATALKYYDKALANNHYNPLLHYYMNVCYGYLGMYDQKHFLSKYYNEKQVEYYQYKKNKLEYLSYFGGTLASNNLSKNAAIDITNGSNFFGKIDRTGSLYFNYLSAQYRFKSRFTLIGSINYNTIIGNQQFNYEYFTGTPPQRVDTAYKIKLSDYKVIQPIGYLQLAYISHKNLKLKLSYGVTNTRYTLLSASPLEAHRDTFKTERTNHFECTVGLMLQYRKPHYQIDVRGFVMPFSKLALLPIPTLSDSDRTQADVSFTYFPLSTNIVSVKAQASVCNTQNTFAKLVYTYEVNAQVYKKLWVNVQYQHNNLKNFIDLEGAVVYNIDDVIKSKIAARFTYYVNQHWELALQYGFMNRTGTYESLQSPGKLLQTTEYKYSNQIINGGVKWNF